MIHLLEIGQAFRMDNPRDNTLGETWFINSIEHPVIHFYIIIDWLVDAQYMDSQTTERTSARIFREDKKGVMLDAQGYGLRIEEELIIWCDQKTFDWYLNRADLQLD